jgi:hypothetical protein
MVKKLLKYVYDWKTLIIALDFFVISYFVANIFFMPFGGCAGCIPDGNGGVSCDNVCKKISPIILALISYVISYLIVIFFSFIKINNKQNSA